MTQLRRLAREFLRGGCRFLGTRRVLLGHLVDLAQARVDLADAFGLLVGGCGDFAHQIGDLGDVGGDFIEGRRRFPRDALALTGLV
ncbi:hypothetical protein GFER_17290, partial [Geoalkalibacter ferrihydriticus DSM 17813]